VEKATGFDPVVGWLVCTAGPERGQDYRLRSERNRIGRDPALEVCIATDPTISRSAQAQVTYDPGLARGRWDGGARGGHGLRGRGG
jgi:hypothetical protein